jgi:hypothetical protein
LNIVSIEPTPNPNSMKLNMDESVPEGVSLQFSRESAAAAPPYVQRLLAIDGVRSVYQVADFIALERAPSAEWQRILSAAKAVFEQQGEAAQSAAEPPGRVTVFVQMLRGIPMQVKLISGTEQLRVALPERLSAVARQAAEAAADFLAERHWVERGVRYGEMQEVGAQVAEEVAAAYDDERLRHLLTLALEQKEPADDRLLQTQEPLPPDVVAERLEERDWRRRYAALERLEPTGAHLPVIRKALNDANPSVRRLAVVYLGEVGSDVVLSDLFSALKDDSAAVRRAAGDCLSDLGDQRATGPMAEALKDPSKLVRWRAARSCTKPATSRPCRPSRPHSVTRSLRWPCRRAWPSTASNRGKGPWNRPGSRCCGSKGRHK